MLGPFNVGSKMHVIVHASAIYSLMSKSLHVVLALLRLLTNLLLHSAIQCRCCVCSGLSFATN